MKRTLSLRREALAELGAADLANVAGAAGTSPIFECLGISWEMTCLDCVTRRGCVVATLDDC